MDTDVVLTGRAFEIEEGLKRAGIHDPGQQAIERPVPISYILPSVRRNTDERRYNKKPLSGIPSGIPALDVAFRGGYKDSFFYIVMGLQGSGKTNWLLYSTLRAAQYFLERGPEPETKKLTQVAFFELEMTARELYERLAAMVSGVSGMDVDLGGVYDASGRRERSLTDGEYENWYAGLDYVSTLPIRVMEGSVSVANIGAKVKEVQYGSQKGTEKKQDIGLVVVDYLQIIAGAGKDKYESVSTATNELRQWALRLDKPVLTACQANRTVHNKEDKRLEAHMAKGTSEIESAATHLFAWNNYSMLLPRDAQPPIAEGDIDILKNRTGPRMVVPLNMEMRTGLFAVPTQTVDELLQEPDKFLGGD